MDLSLIVAAAKARNGLPSDNQLALRLKVSRGAVCHWLQGHNVPSGDVAARLAELAGVDPDAFVAQCEAWRARSPQVRRVWERIARRLLQNAAALSVLLLLTPGTPRAQQMNGPEMSPSERIHYATFRRSVETGSIHRQGRL
jgi:transcriptional regulator with XRE-family HTH domain